jgi:transcriptional regulator GlxA family with amidase domain
MHASLTCLLLAMVRIWKDNGYTPPMMATQPEDDSIETITEYIDAHSNQPLKVEDLASLCNMSYSFFAKKFRQLYGRSCKEYIEYIRVTKAEDLLLFSDYDLTYISQETGFSDCSHMIKTFRKYKNITPKQYRLQNTKALH